MLKLFNFFNPELQLINTKSEIKIKLMELLTQLKGFKFLTTLVLVFKKIESEDKTSITVFIYTQKQKLVPMKVTLIMCFNQSILQLHQTYKNVY